MKTKNKRQMAAAARTRDLVVAEGPRHFDMRAWLGTDHWSEVVAQGARNVCDTTWCIAGAAVIAHPRSYRLVGGGSPIDGSVVEVRTGYHVGWSSAAQRLLGLDDLEERSFMGIGASHRTAVKLLDLWAQGEWACLVEHKTRRVGGLPYTRIERDRTKALQYMENSYSNKGIWRLP